MPVAERPWFRPVWQATTPGAVLDNYAQVCALINGRAARLIEVVRRAADDSPQVAELWETLQRARHAGAMMVVRHLATLEPLPERFDIDQASDIVWTLDDPAHYNALVNHRGWTQDDYTAWIADHMRHGLGIAAKDA